MNTEIVKVDPQEFKVTDETAKQVKEQFLPMLEAMENLEEDFNSVMNLPPDDPKTSIEAKKLRLEYMRIRTGTQKIHKAQKQFYLNGGRFVDAWKNAQVFASQGKEDKLKEIENYAELQEKKRLDELREKREKEMSKYMEEFHTDLATMEEDVYKAYKQAKKQAYEDRIAAEKEAEKQRKEAEKKRLAEEKQREKERKEALKKAKAAEAKLQKEREERRREAEKIQAKLDAVEAERKAQAEKLKAKEEAERKAKEAEERKRQAEEAEKERLAKAGEKEQLYAWLTSLSLDEPPVNSDTATEIAKRFQGFKKWAEMLIERM
jgi:trichohyalin